MAVEGSEATELGLRRWLAMGRPFAQNPGACAPKTLSGSSISQDADPAEQHNAHPGHHALMSGGSPTPVVRRYGITQGAIQHTDEKA